jgi:hypothetical protein
MGIQGQYYVGDPSNWLYYQHPKIGVVVTLDGGICGTILSTTVVGAPTYHITGLTPTCSGCPFTNPLVTSSLYGKEGGP